MSMASTFAIPFDTLAFVKKLETAGVPSAQAKALSGVLQKVEECRLQELATRGDILRLEKEIELAKTELQKEISVSVANAKTEIIKWVVGMGVVILGGMMTINRLFPPIQAYYPPLAQELRQPVPSPQVQVPPAPPTPTRQ
ncbi:MAG: CCDC90 family protein [Magnetococcus sp. MYC-9]